MGFGDLPDAGAGFPALNVKGTSGVQVSHQPTPDSNVANEPPLQAGDAKLVSVDGHIAFHGRKDAGFKVGGFGEVLDLPVDTGIGVVLDFKKFLISEGMSEEGMKIHVIGGVDDDDHKYFEALWEMKESYPDVWKELGKFVVPFQKIKDDPTCSTEVYLKHPKTILVSFFSLAEYTPSNT